MNLGEWTEFSKFEMEAGIEVTRADKEALARSAREHGRRLGMVTSHPHVYADKSLFGAPLSKTDAFRGFAR